MSDNVRPLRPQTDDAVPAVLREALDKAVAGELRGVVVMLAYHDRTPYEHLTAGDLSLGDMLVLVESWKFAQFSKQEEG